MIRFLAIVLVWPRCDGHPGAHNYLCTDKQTGELRRHWVDDGKLRIPLLSPRYPLSEGRLEYNQ